MQVPLFAEQEPLLEVFEQVAVKPRLMSWVALCDLEAEAAPWAEELAEPFEEAVVVASWADVLLWLEQAAVLLPEALLLRSVRGVAGQPLEPSEWLEQPKRLEPGQRRPQQLVAPQ